MCQRLTVAERKAIVYPFGTEVKQDANSSPSTYCNSAKKIGCLYVVTNEDINYGGKTVSGNSLHNQTNLNSKDVVNRYKIHTGKEPSMIPVGHCPTADLEKYEAHFHMCIMICYLLKLKNPYLPKLYKNSYPYCLNLQTNSSFFTNDSLEMINQYNAMAERC